MTLESERQRIAAAVNQLRPDWPVKSLLSLLDSDHLANRPRRDVCVALTWIACDIDSQTPARIREDGPWWRATNADNDAAWSAHLTNWRPPHSHEACRKHPGEWANRCRGCAADRLTGDETPERTSASRMSPTAQAWLGQIKADLGRRRMTTEPPTPTETEHEETT